MITARAEAAYPAGTSTCRWQHRTVLAAMGLMIAVTVWGCSSSSPRFRSSPQPGSEESAEAREEATLDDRRFDPEEIRRRLTPGARRTYANLTPAGIERDKVLLGIVRYLGVPYSYGGASMKGMDCSGFTLRVYGEALGTELPRSASGQYAAGVPVLPDRLQFGDLVFFNTTGESPSHVGIYIEDDVFAHASVNDGVTLSSLESMYYRERFVGARRVVGRRGAPGQE